MEEFEAWLQSAIFGFAGDNWRYFFKTKRPA